MYDVLARHDGVRFLHDGTDRRRTQPQRGSLDLARLTAALGNELTWEIADSALDPFEPKQIRAARQRLDPAWYTSTTWPAATSPPASTHPAHQPHPLAPVTVARAFGTCRPTNRRPRSLPAVSHTEETALGSRILTGRPVDSDLQKQTPQHWPDGFS